MVAGESFASLTGHYVDMFLLLVSYQYGILDKTPSLLVVSMCQHYLVS